ncbi:MAG: glutathione S-transferase family protein [Betaproteobacteria bacterium]|nr:glutathione S-transferase family protein [Betaproteobacteria bacterium]
MYQLFIANKNYSSWSLRPWILMRQLQIPFEEKIFSFGSCSFRDFSPSGHVPCLHDGDTVVWDSLAIVEYLAERHDGVWSEDKKVRAWERSVTAEMHSGFNALRQHCSMNCGIRVRLTESPDALQRDIARIDELWTEGLERFGGPFLSGNRFHAADAFFAPVAFRVSTYGLTLGAAAAGYARQLLALPAMQSWYEAALREPWRDPAHEAEILQFGTILEDKRQPGTAVDSVNPLR